MDNSASDDQAQPVAAAAPLADDSPRAVAEQTMVGPTLRAARERMGLSLSECASQLFIRQGFLEALEDGRHRDLPGGAYAAGFLRTYAEFLGLDSEELVRRFRLEGAGGFTNRTELAFPSPVSEGRIPGGAVIFLGLVLAGLTYGGWYLLSSRETEMAEMVPPLPERLSLMLNRQAALTGESRTPESEAARPREEVVPPSEGDDDRPADPATSPPSTSVSVPPVPAAPSVAAVPAPAGSVSVGVPPLPPAPVEPVAAKPEPAKVEPAKVDPAKPEPAKPEPAKVEPAKVDPAKPEPAKPEPPKPEPAKVDPAAAVDPAALPAGKVFGAEHAESRVMLRAVANDCWVQVRDADGTSLTSRLLRRGDTLRLPNRPGLVLMVGNAGALEVSVDGRRAPPLGAIGQVRRDIRVDPDRLGTGG